MGPNTCRGEIPSRCNVIEANMYGIGRDVDAQPEYEPTAL